MLEWAHSARYCAWNLLQALSSFVWDNLTDNTHSNSSALLSERIFDRLSSPRKPKTDCNMVTQWFLVSLMPHSNVVGRRGLLSKEQATPTAPRVRVLSGHPSDSLVFSYSCPPKINLTSLPAKANQTGCQWSLPLAPSPRNIERNCITVRGTSWSARPIATTKS